MAEEIVINKIVFKCNGGKVWYQNPRWAPAVLSYW